MPKDAPAPLTAVASPAAARQPTTPIMAIFLTARRLTRSKITSVLFVSISDTPLEGETRMVSTPSSIALWLNSANKRVAILYGSIGQRVRRPFKHPEVRIGGGRISKGAPQWALSTARSLRRPLTSVLGASAPAHRRIIGGKMHMPLAPAYAHGQLKAMYGAIHRPRPKPKMARATGLSPSVSKRQASGRMGCRCFDQIGRPFCSQPSESRRGGSQFGLSRS